MSMFRKFSELCFHFLERNLSKPEYLSDSAEQLFGPTDLNLIFTDVRPDGARQKAKSFFTVIERFLEQGLVVSAIVYTNHANAKKVDTLYRDIFSQFKHHSEFRIVVAQFNAMPWRTLWLAILTMLVSLRLAPKYPNAGSELSITIASLAARNWQFRRLFDDFTTGAWLGLTGGIELPALAVRRDQCGSDALISALQFGQVSEDQYHFEGYKVDKLFVYDTHAQNVMASRVSSTSEVIVSGSPEFEYELLRLGDIPPRPYSGCLELLFIDQPIRQRSEFDDAFVKSLENVLLQLSESGSVKVAIKTHPRGSAFFDLPPELYFTGDIAEQLPHAHIVVTCFSNLADLSVLNGTTTIYVGASRVLGEGKLTWIRDSGGKVLERPEDLEAAIRIEQRCTLSSDTESKGRPSFHSELAASKVILSQATNTNVT